MYYLNPVPWRKTVIILATFTAVNSITACAMFTPKQDNRDLTSPYPESVFNQPPSQSPPQPENAVPASNEVSEYYSTPTPVAKFDVVAYLNPETAPGSLERGSTYVIQSMTVVQKIPQGYIFTGNPDWYHMDAGLGYLVTRLHLNSDIPYCAQLSYMGTFTYTANDGFTRTIPKFRVYKKTIFSPNCIND